MSNISDPLFNQYANTDFTDAKPVSGIPALARIQALHGGKSRITMRVDTNTLAIFKARAKMTGGNYQTLNNEALRQYAKGQTLAEGSARNHPARAFAHLKCSTVPFLDPPAEWT